MNQDPTDGSPPASPAADPQRALVERIQHGIDYEASCEQLYRLMRHRVRGMFATRGFSGDETDELTQETFIRVFTHIGKLRDPSRFVSWLFEMTVNVYRNELRRRGAAKRDAYEESIDQSAGEPGGVLLDALVAGSAGDPSPLDSVLRREQSASFHAALAKLPPQMRRSLELRVQDFKYREIAALLGISIETVKAHLHQAQKRLKQVLGEAAGGEGEEHP
jgi:RNA polymerase sigma factor (sigma-70 family)